MTGKRHDARVGLAAPVSAVTASAATVPTDLPEGDGTLTWSSTTLVLVEVEAEGQVGTGYTYAPAAAVRVVDDLVAPVVLGADALAPTAVHVEMARAVRNAGRPGLVGMALSAVDIALWDLTARLHGLPLARLWGGPVTDVEVYGSGGFTTYDDDQLTSQLTSWLELGLPRVKIKIGESWGQAEGRDLHRTELARKTVGRGVELYVDANGGYSVGQACRVGRTLDDLGVTWFEEPVSSDDPAGLRRVRESVAADVAAGEYAHDPTYLAHLAGSVDCLQADVTRCGGYTSWLHVSGLARGLQVDLSGHCAPYLTLPVAAVTPGLRHLEWFHDHVRTEQRLFDGTPEPREGRLTPGTEPGHGLVLRRPDFDHYRVA
jgi:L-alanine-DL-glutamate epimerase-like enolase superfamily enzyme